MHSALSAFGSAISAVKSLNTLSKTHRKKTTMPGEARRTEIRIVHPKLKTIFILNGALLAHEVS